MNSIKSCIILAGGFGTRLQSVVSSRQKVVAEVQGKPFLHLLFEHLINFGIHKVVLCVHYLGNQVKDLIGEHYKSLNIEYSFETSPLGTAGAIRQAWINHLPHENTVFAMNGDSICLANYKHYIEWYFQQAVSPAAGLLLTQVEDISRYGSVITDNNQNVLNFSEKGGSGAGFINAGVYLLNKRVLDFIPPQTAVSLEKEIFPRLTGQGIKAYKVNAPFIDIGIPESYAAAANFKFELCDNQQKHAVLIDRDGTLIIEKVYLHDPDQVELLPGAIEGLQKLLAHNIIIAIVTNQSGVSRNYYSIQDVHAVHQRIQDLLAEYQIELKHFFICPHQDQDNCDCRKPKPGLAIQAQKVLNFDFNKTFVIGDKECDVAMGKAVGAIPILVRTGYGHEYEQRIHSAEVVKDNLLDAASWIIDKLNSEKC